MIVALAADNISEAVQLHVALDVDYVLDGDHMIRGRKRSPRTNNGTLSRRHIYELANQYCEFLNRDLGDACGASVANRFGRLWDDIRSGGSYN